MNQRLIIDLRTEPERQEVGFYPEALSIPVPKPPLSFLQHHQMRNALVFRLNHLDRRTPIAVHCAKGIRSEIGTAMLHQMGFVDVQDWGTFRG